MSLSKAIAVAALAAGLVLAQRGPGHQGGQGGTPPDPAQLIQMRVDRLAELLSLTDQQKTAVTKILTDAETSSQAARTDMKNNRTALDAAVKKSDANAIQNASLAIGTATGQLTAIQGNADAAIYKLLTPDQQAKFDQMPHGFGGPGGMGGPGPMGGFGRQGRGGQRQ
jgi:Spy/CpxP family protein refolding chaperone